MRHQEIETSTGPFALIEHDDGTLATTWVTDEVRATLAASRRDRSLAIDLVSRIRAYFAGELVDFSDVPTPGSDGFFARCWDACRAIPRGNTCSYGALAERAGSSARAARAAGQAMRRNPLPIIIPCHRVIGAGGDLHGFAGSRDAAGRELAIKTALLQIEGVRSLPSTAVSLYAQAV